MPTAVECPSKSQVNKAGRLLRRYMRGDGEAYSAAELDRAIVCLLEFRAAHQYSLTKATMGLRSMVKTEGCVVEVTQRLKRSPTIINKLRREPTMQLANMHDIGGCRAVLRDIDEVRRVERRLRKNRPPIRSADYVATPRPSGYRAVHLVVEYSERAIEVQLRSQSMHAWAITVERLAGRLGDLKSGIGPPEVLHMMEVVSEAMALEETGQVVDDALLARLSNARAAAVPYLHGGS